MDERISKYYLDFMKKYSGRITDTPTIENVSKIYLENKDNVNFSSIEDGGYPFLVDLKNNENSNLGMFLDGHFFVDGESLSRLLPKNGVIKLLFENSNFIDFENKNRRQYFYPDQCKLWLNVKQENSLEVGLELSKFLNKNHAVISTDGNEAQTCFKIPTHHDRNDAITIYTNYKEADAIIEFLISLKGKRPELFENENKTNPLVSKIDNFISYADITHATSCPYIIAETFSFLSKNKNEIDSQPKENQIDYIKSLILNRIYERTNYGFCPVDTTLNINDFGSEKIYGISFRDLTADELNNVRAEIKKEIEKLNEKTEKQVEPEK